MGTKRRGMRYLDTFVSSKCAPDMLCRKLFPNSKEITESYGAYQAVVDHLPHLNRGDKRVCIVAVGDGSRPRTAATFAFRTGWRCISIDPALREGSGQGVHRLEVLPHRVEEVTVYHRGPIVVVAVHSHANLENSVGCARQLADWRYGPEGVSVVAIPCCISQTLWGREPDVEYVDEDIWSPKNTIKVWKEV